MDTILIFAGGDSPPDELLEDLPEAARVVAADSGYDAAAALGLEVDVLIGDMDSVVAQDIPDRVRVIRYPTDKDATDLELALDLAARDGPRRVVVVGGSGGRLDHELATAGLLCSSRWIEIDELDWASPRGWAYVVRRRRVIHGDVGTTLTLVPMGGDVTGIHTRGLRWDLTDDMLPYGTTRGVSNVMRSPVADIRVGRGCLLVILPSAYTG